MRDIRRSKIAKRYQFSKWFQDHVGWISFIWLIILIGLPIITMDNKTVCIIAMLSHLLFFMLFLLVPEYKSIEDCQKQMGIKTSRKRERKNRKWLM